MRGGGDQEPLETRKGNAYLPDMPGYTAVYRTLTLGVSGRFVASSELAVSLVRLAFHPRVGLYILFSPSTIYILLLIFSPDHLYSREYSRILRIFLPRGRSTEAKNRSKVEVLCSQTAEERPKLKFSVCVDPKPTVEVQKSCSEKL